MSDRALRRLALVLAIAPLPLLPCAFAVVVATGVSVGQDVWAAPVLCLGFSGAGLLVVRAVPRNAVGWLLLGVGAVGGVNAVTSAVVAWDLSANDPVTGAALTALLNTSVQLFALGFLIPRVVLLFPDGRPPSRRWRVVGGAQLAVVLDLTLHLVVPGPLDDTPRRYANPLGLDALSFLVPWLDAVNVVGSVLFVVGTLGSVLALVARARRARGVERVQIEWVAWAAGVIGLVFVANGVLGQTVGIGILEPFLTLALCLFPAAVAVAIVRYRLYDVAHVVSRTIVYASLTAILGAAYVGLVLAGQGLFSSFAGGSNLAIAASTLVVAALFLPLRSRVQRVVDRRFDRRRYDARQTLEAFGARLREQVELESLASDLRGVIGETVAPEHVSLWLRGAVRCAPTLPGTTQSAAQAPRNPLPGGST